MHTLVVTGMTCGGCTKAVTRAIQMQDASATVQVDLDTPRFKQAEGNKMHTLVVTGMTCGGCTKAVTRAIQMQDASATVQVDLATQKLEIESKLDREALITIVTNAGFPLAN